MFAMQPEEGALTFNEMRQSLEQAETSRKSEADEDELALMKLWSRVPGQVRNSNSSTKIYYLQLYSSF